MSRSLVADISGYSGLALGAALVVVAGDITGAISFTRFFGALNPMLAVSIVAVAGIAAYWFLASKGWHFWPRTWKRVWMFLLLAAALACGMAFVDFLAPLPADTNILLPWALVFYPAMGFVAQTVFHIVPMALIFLCFALFGYQALSNGAITTTLIAVAFPEPFFQIWGGISSGQIVWTDFYIAANVFVFSLVELWAFRKAGFLAMFTTRMAYYLVWHLIWGHLRLAVLF